MLQSQEFNNLFESVFDLSLEREVTDTLEMSDKKLKLLKLIDNFRAKYPAVFNKGPNVEFLGKIADAIESDDIEQLKSMAGMINRTESRSSSTVVRDLARVIRQIVANMNLNENISHHLLIIAESLEMKLIVD